MNIGQYDISPAGAGGYFASAPRLLSTVAQAETEYPHTFGRPPDYMVLRFNCVAADTSWVAGESWILAGKDQGGAADGVTMLATNGKLTVSWSGSTGANILLPGRAGGAAGLITTSSWEYQVVAHWFAPF